MKEQTVFQGAATALITPMNEKGVDYPALKKLIDWQIEEGIDALVICGTTGEGSTLSDGEHKEVLRFSLEVAAGRVPMIAGTGSNDTAYAVALTKHACQLGYDGVLVVTPYYNKTTQKGLIASFTAIAEASTKPVILYNVPSRTGINLEAATVARLAQLPNIAAVKEASGNLEQASQIKSMVPADFLMYSGDDSLTLPLLSLGACGIISVASHLIGDSIQEMVAAFEKGDNARALELHLACYNVFRKLFICSNPIPLKYCLNRIGINVGPCRLPLTGVCDEHARILDDMLAEVGLL